MVAKLVATFILVLCILPSTAPFSSVGSTHALGAQHSETAIQSPVNHTSAADADDDDALVLERSTFLRHSRLCAGIVAGFCDTAIVSAPFVGVAAPLIVTVDSPPLNSILRL